MGDTSDNIPGVPGIGEKTAKALISSYGPIESIFDHVEEVTPTRAQNALRGNRDHAMRSKHLATIVRDIEIELDPETARIDDFDREAVVGLMRDLEIRSLLNRIPETKRAPVRIIVERAPSNRQTIASIVALGCIRRSYEIDRHLRHRCGDYVDRSHASAAGWHFDRGIAGGKRLHPDRACRRRSTELRSRRRAPATGGDRSVDHRTRAPRQVRSDRSAAIRFAGNQCRLRHYDCCLPIE